MQALHGCCQRGSEDNSAQLVYPSPEGNRLGTAPKPGASENKQYRMYAVQIVQRLS